MLKAKCGVILLFLAVVTGCAHFQKTSPTTMSGDWSLQLDNGKKYNVSINQVDPSRILINADKLHISGQYSLKNNKLVLQKANESRISGVKFVGKDDDTWVMVKAPLASRIGYQLNGSSLTRKN